MKRRLFKILKFVFLLLLLLIVAGYFLVNTSWGQHKLMDYTTHQLSDDLGVTVSYSDLEINFFNDFSLNGFYMEDKKGDTLLYVAELHGEIESIDRKHKIIQLSKLELSEPFFNLNRAQGDSTDNIQFILDRYFQPKIDDGKKKWKVLVSEVLVTNGTFRRDDFNKQTKDLMDVSHLDLTGVDADISEISSEGDGLSMNIRKIGFADKSGFTLKELSSHILINNTKIQFGDLSVQTANSNMNIDGELSYPEGKYFNNFIEDVKIVGQIKGGKINTNDLAYFIKDFKNTNEEVEVSGKIVGKVSRLKGKELEIAFGDRSLFKGNMSFDGLPNINETFINFKVKSLTSDYNDIKGLDFPFLGNLISSLPSKMSKLGRMRFGGNFTGFIHDFAAYGNLQTALGKVKSNVALIRNKTTDQYRIKGEISTPSFDLQSYLGNPEWGGISARLKMDAKGRNFRELSAKLEGGIESIEYKGYKYENLEINGLLDENLFNGEISGEEPNLGFDFNGTINLQERKPIYDFNLVIRHADPVALHLSKQENWKKVSAEISTTMKGSNIDDIGGTAILRNLVLMTTTDSLMVDSVYFSATTLSDGSRELKMNSTEMDVLVAGNFKSKELVAGVKQIMSDIMPSWYDGKEKSSGDMTVSCDIEFKDTQQLLDVFVPELSVSNGSHLEGDINTKERQFHVNGVSDSIVWKGIELLDFKLTSERFSDRAYIMLENRKTKVTDRLKFDDNIFTAYMYNDSLEGDLTWSTQDLNTSGFFSTLTVFEGFSSGVISFLPSDLIINEEYWSIKERYPIRFDGKEIEVDKFTIGSAAERLIFDGALSENPKKEFFIDLESFQLNHVNGLVKSERFEIDGLVNMKASLTNVYNHIGIETELTVDDIVLMKREMGDLKITSDWRGGKQAFNVDGKLTKDGEDVIDLAGIYDPNEEKDKLNAVLTLNNVALDLLGLTNAKGISDFGGMASGALHVGGLPTKPDVKGKLYLKDAHVKIDYLNTSYTFSEEVLVRNDWIGLDDGKVYDELGNMAKVSGTVGHNNYHNWNYDFMVEFDNLLCLNVEKGMNDMFYGTGFAQGSAFISGFNSNISVEVNAKSNKGTVINIPLGEEGDVKLENFISFKNPNTKQEAHSMDLTGLDLNLNLDITRDAFIRLIFDEQIGDVMEGIGNGVISMDIDSRGDFNMFGNYTIEEGNYLFTLKNIVNKRFDVEKGGTITWFGDPYEALIDIHAVYKVRASPSEFASENPDITSRNVLTLCKMHLKNRLLTPDIEFEIDMPNINPNLRSLVIDKVNSELELNRQFFSLLVLNKFLPSQSSTGETGFSVIDTGVNTGFEFLANQLSNWLSQISSDVDIGVNYRPGDQISNQELAVALSTQLFNERLLVSGNLGVSESSEIAGSKTALIGDFILEYMLTEEGRLRLKVFNETNDFNIVNTDQAGSTQGIGLVIYREFDPLWKEEN